MSPTRFVQGVIKYGTLPFRPRFDQHLFWVDRTLDDGSLDQLRGLEEMNRSAWKGLETIGYDLVRRFRPKVVVELGTQMGLSAFAMGLALKANGKGGQLFAVDTWEDEEHAGRYDESVYQTPHATA